MKRHKRLKRNVFQFKEENKKGKSKYFREIMLRILEFIRGMTFHVQCTQKNQIWIHKNLTPTIITVKILKTGGKEV